MRTITFHNKTVRTDFLRFTSMRWFVTEFKNNSRNYYRYTEFCINETLCNFYASCNYNFKVYMKKKLGKPRDYGLFFVY